MYLATGEDARSAEAVGTKISLDAAEVSFGTTAEHRQVRRAITFFAGARSDAFFFDFDGIKKLFDTSGGRNFTAPHLGGKSPWTGNGFQHTANVFSMASELPTASWAPIPTSGSGAAAALRKRRRAVHVDRAGHPSVSSFFNTDDTKEEYNASEPVQRP